VRGHGTTAAIALFVALAAVGCGLGPGKGLGDVELTVTRDYGTVPVLHRELGDVTESDTVMRALERNAEITTRYGGDFVQSIGGVEAEETASTARDWFFYVNGVESTVGAADYPLHGGEAIWWDYRDWGAAMRVPAVVGSWPQPFLDGYDGRKHPVVVDCLGGGAACETVSERLKAAGVGVAAGDPSDAIRILVGPWVRLREDPAAGQIEEGTQTSGVFADFLPEASGFALQGLDEGGEPARRFGPDAGLVAATRLYESPPTWLVTGEDAAGVAAAAALLDGPDLRDRYAVVVEAGKDTPLPVR
jgi:Domain of unknown function (DUF4430)